MNDRHLLVITDAGAFRAYEVDYPPGRPPFPRILESVEIVEPHQKLSDRVSDQAGAFPRGDAPNSSSHAEQPGIPLEVKTRALKEVAEHIDRVLCRENATTWSLAVPSEIHNALLDYLPKHRHKNLREIVKRDLVNVHDRDLPGYFSLKKAKTEAP